MSKNVYRDSMQTFADNIYQSLEKSQKDGKLFWKKPWRKIDMKYRNAFTNRLYSGMHNILTCLTSDFSDPRYATFNAIRKNGGSVKKGSKSIFLIAWNFSKKTVLDKDGNQETKSIPFAKSIPLFNVEQTEGLNLPSINKEVLNSDLEANEIILQIFKDLKIKVQHKLTNTAAYIPSQDSIEIPDVQLFQSVDDWSSVCLHEIVHWTASRVNRDCSQYNFDINERAMEELVAELGSMYLSMQLKINNTFEDSNSLAYVSDWLKASKEKNGKRFFYKACKLAEEAGNFILNNCQFEKQTDTSVAA